jgi:hypothetical protein
MSQFRRVFFRGETGKENLMRPMMSVVAGTMLLYATMAGPQPLWAFSGGITGASGKQSRTCAACHGGGVAPLVRFIGPSSIGPGETATYRFEVESRASNQMRAGFNVAAGDGRLDALPNQQARRAPDGELTHSRPQQSVAMVAAWEMTWTAPETPGTYTLFGSGNSVNGNGDPTGDRSSATSLLIAVADSTPTPTPFESPATPTPSATASAMADPTPAACTGDCDADGRVTVNELITIVNIALGNVGLEGCADVDVNASGTAEITELIAAINRALQGCP